MSTNDLICRRIPTGQRRNSRTNCTVTPMDTNVPTAMTVGIVCIQRRATERMPLQRIRWEVICYTDDYQVVPSGVGREKRGAKPVSFKKYLQ